MTPREELIALRRLAELEKKASSGDGPDLQSEQELSLSDRARLMASGALFEGGDEAADHERGQDAEHEGAAHLVGHRDLLLVVHHRLDVLPARVELSIFRSAWAVCGDRKSASSTLAG